MIWPVWGSKQVTDWRKSEKWRRVTPWMLPKTAPPMVPGI